MLATIPVEFSFFEVGLRLEQVGLGGFVARFGGLHSRFGGVDGGGLGLHIGVSLNVFLRQKDFTFLDVVAFLDDDRSDPAKSLGGHVGIRSGLDFPRGGDLRDQTLLWGNLGGLHLVGLVHAKEHNSAQHRRGADADSDLLPRLHGFLLGCRGQITRAGLQTSRILSVVRYLTYGPRSGNVSLRRVLNLHDLAYFWCLQARRGRRRPYPLFQS